MRAVEENGGAAQGAGASYDIPEASIRGGGAAIQIWSPKSRPCWPSSRKAPGSSPADNRMVRTWQAPVSRSRLQYLCRDEASSVRRNGMRSWQAWAISFMSSRATGRVVLSSRGPSAFHSWAARCPCGMLNGKWRNFGRGKSVIGCLTPNSAATMAEVHRHRFVEHLPEVLGGGLMVGSSGVDQGYQVAGVQQHFHRHTPSPRSDSTHWAASGTSAHAAVPLRTICWNSSSS